MPTVEEKVQQTIGALFTANAQLECTIEQLQKENKELREKLGTVTSLGNAVPVPTVQPASANGADQHERESR